MNIHKFEIPKFNKELTLIGGQSFVWEYDLAEDTYVGVSVNSVCKITSGTDTDSVEQFGINEDSKVLVREDFPNLAITDVYVERAIKKLGQILILDQEPLSVIISFIISANNSILRIRRSINQLRKSYGEKLVVGDDQYYLFPTLERLLTLTEKDWKELGVGYRSGYLVATVEILNTVDFKSFDSPELLYKFLRGLPGVGPKVADCILVFGYGYRNITPIDTWGKKIAIDLYDAKADGNYNYYRDFFTERFGTDTALAGQYLFEWYRNSKH